MFWRLSIFWLIVCAAGSIAVNSSANWSLSYWGFFALWVLGFAILYVLCGINIIKEWERRAFLLFGKYSKTAGPGFCWVEPAFHIMVQSVSVQDVVTSLTVENVQTKDNVRLSMLMVITTRISAENVKKYVVEVKDATKALEQRAITSMTEEVGRNSLDMILENRTQFSKDLTALFQEKIVVWGIAVQAVEIRDIKIADPDIERSIAMKAKATKEAEAELKRAEMQIQIAGALKSAAAAMDESAWRLKSYETLIEMTRSAQNNTIIIPANISDFAKSIMSEPKK